MARRMISPMANQRSKKSSRKTGIYKGDSSWFCQIFHRFSKDFPIFSTDFPRIFQWFPHIFHRFSKDFPMISPYFPQIFKGFSNDFPIFSTDFPRVTLTPPSSLRRLMFEAQVLELNVMPENGVRPIFPCSAHIFRHVLPSGYVKIAIENGHL